MSWEIDAERPPTPLPLRSCLTWDGVAKLFGPLHVGGALPLTRAQMLARIRFMSSRTSTSDPYRNGPVRQHVQASFALVRR